MMKGQKVILFAVAAGLGLVAGFATRATKVAQGSAGSVSASSSPSPLESRQTDRAGLEDQSVAARLERNLSLSTGVTRWLCWLDALEKSQASDFPRLYKLAAGDPAAKKLVSDRWIQFHPRYVFDYVVAMAKHGNSSAISQLGYQLFRQWSRADADAAIAALNGSENFVGRDSCRHTVAAEVIRNDAERGLRLFVDWHIDDFTPFTDGIEKWAAADPRHAAEFASQYSAGAVTHAAMESIGKIWGKTDPAAALNFAAANAGEFGSLLAGTALKEWAGNNLNDAADWLANADPHTRARLSPTFVESWAKSDPGAALDWCDANLSGSALAQAVTGVVKGAADKDLANAAALVTSMEPSGARAQAAAIVAKKYFPNLSGDQPTKPEAIAWLSGLDNDSLRSALSEAEWCWATTDPKSMANFLSTKSSEQMPQFACDLVARRLAATDPLGALNWANHLPPDRALGAGADAFTEWRRSQPDAATAWFNGLSSTDPRRMPCLEGTIRMLAWDANYSPQLATLTGDDRATARNVIAGMNLSPTRRSALLDMLKQ
jgi:hypothetical protein